VFWGLTILSIVLAAFRGWQDRIALKREADEAAKASEALEQK
jgi:hypothetical protein